MNVTVEFFITIGGEYSCLQRFEPAESAGDRYLKE